MSEPVQLNPTLRAAGWSLFLVGMALGLYGKYFHAGLYRWYGVIVVAAGSALLIWFPGRPSD